MDKSTLLRVPVAKGRAYCEKPYVSCYYGKGNVCVNCLRPKGWRVHKLNRSRLDRIAGR